jgi:hypothetical protein
MSMSEALMGSMTDTEGVDALNVVKRTLCDV